MSDEVKRAPSLWLYPAASARSAICEDVNRPTVRLRQRCASLVNGLNRLRVEHFTLFLASAATNKVVEISAPALSYYADPFIWQREGRTHILCEEFRYMRNKAHLRWISLDSKLRPVTSHIVATAQGHTSFPFLVEHLDTLYLIPETCEEGGIHLYRCDKFPAQWTRLRTLVPILDAVDTVAFKQNEHWWLITSIRVSHSGCYLAIFFADDLLSDDWQPHPINARKLYQGQPNNSGRNAGAIIRWGGRLLRPAQHNPNYYGESIRWMDITKLTETDYSEYPLPSTHPLAQFSERLSMHHFAVCGDFVAWDVRDRVWPRAMNARAKASRKLSVAPLGGDLANFIRSLA